MTTLEELSTDLHEFREETNMAMEKINGRLRLQETWTARLQGALMVVAMLGVGNVVAIVMQR